MTAAIKQGTDNNIGQINYARNAMWMYWILLLVDLIGLATAFTLIQFGDYPPLYDLYLLELSIVPIIYTIGYFLIRRDRLVAGVTVIAVTYGLAFASFTFGILDLGFLDTLIIGIGIWQIAILSLPRLYRGRLIAFGILLAGVNFFSDIVVPYERLLIREISFLAPITISLIVVMLSVLFWINYRQYDLRTKFIFAMVGIAIISSITTFLGISYITRNQATNASFVALQTYARARAQLIEDFIDIRFSTMSAISQNSGIISALNEENMQLTSLNGGLMQGKLSGREKIWENEDNRFGPLHHVLFFDTIRNPASDRLRSFKTRSFEDAEQLFIVNKFGALVAMTERGDTGQYIHNQTEWWPIVSGEASGLNDTYVGFPITLANGSTGIPIAVPIINQNNQFIGAVHAVIPTGTLLNQINDTIEDDQEDLELAILFDQQFLPLDGGSRTTQASPFTLETVDDLLAGVFVRAPYDGDLSVITASQLTFSTDETVSSNRPWIIFAAQPQASIDNLIVTQQRVQTFLGGAVILVATMLAVAFAQLVSAPILRLSGVAGRLEAGELSARADIHTSDEIGVLASSFNAMAEQSQQLVRSLETRVAERTQFLETSFRVSQSLSSITEKDQLLQAVVDQLQSSFDYYHVHVYLLNEINQRLELVAGSGDVGQQLLRQNHSLPVGTGLVGQAALNNLSVLIPNVEEEEKWVPNRLLPETKSEMSVPISIGDAVLGVIDVQENKIDRLQAEDADLVQSIARQVAVALRNVDQINQIRKKAEQEALINHIRAQISSTNNIEDAVKIAVKELGVALKSKDTAINLQLGPPKSTTLADIQNGETDPNPLRKLPGQNGKVNHNNGTK